MEITFRLENFEGPLDLLLHLISRNKVSIYDIPIAEILDQYMEVLHAAQTLDMDIAGDFIAMAAQLIYIKSQMLLPRHEEESDEDPRAKLIEMLLEYQQIKETMPYFRKQTDQGRDIFVKAPEPKKRFSPVEYRQKPEDLIAAARNMLQKLQRRLPPPMDSFTNLIGREAVPVSGKITMILKLFLTRSRLRFLNLFQGAKNRSEVVATFLAVLELSKTRQIQIEGEGSNVELTLEAFSEEEI